MTYPYLDPPPVNNIISSKQQICKMVTSLINVCHTQTLSISFNLENGELVAMIQTRFVSRLMSFSCAWEVLVTGKAASLIG